MTAEWLNVIAAVSAAIAAFFAWWIALMSLRDSRRLAHEARRRDAQALEASLQARLDPLYPGLRAVLGTVDDGVPIPIRSVLIPLFVLYADAYAAHRDGILSDAEWKGFGLELANWAQREPARRAWAIFRKQEWTDGFVEHVDGVLDGPPAYPRMGEVPLTEPEIVWPAVELGDPPGPTPQQPAPGSAATAEDPISPTDS